MYDEILVPTGGEHGIETVVEHAASVAAEEVTTAHVLYVIDDQAFLTLDDEIKADVLDDLRAEGKHAVERASDLLEAAGIAAETAITRGKPADEILHYVDEQGIDLVTMGTRGTDYADNMLGSTAQSVVAEAQVPVLTVNHPAGEDD